MKKQQQQHKTYITFICKGLLVSTLSVLLSFQTSIDSAYGLSKLSFFFLFRGCEVGWGRQSIQTNTFRTEFIREFWGLMAL